MKTEHYGDLSVSYLSVKVHYIGGACVRRRGGGCAMVWLVAWHSGRTSVFGRRFPCPALNLQLMGGHLCE